MYPSFSSNGTGLSLFPQAKAGPTSSTMVGHAKTCSIVMLGWISSRRGVSDKSLVGKSRHWNSLISLSIQLTLLGIIMAIGGIIRYSIVMGRTGKKA